MRRSLYLALAASTLLANSASATPPLEQRCPNLGHYLEKLSGDHHEAPRIALWSGRNAIVVTTHASPNRGWTALVIEQMGKDCVVTRVFAGKGWWQKLPGAPS